jgi:hypothetical protein
MVFVVKSLLKNLGYNFIHNAAVAYCLMLKKNLTDTYKCAPNFKQIE